MAVCSAGWAGAAVCGAARRDGLRFGRGRRLGEFGRGLARLAGLGLRPGRRGCADRRNRFGLGDHRRLGPLQASEPLRRAPWPLASLPWPLLRCRGCRLRCRGRRRIWGLGRRHGGLGHALWRGIALLRGGRLGDQIAVQLPPLAILAGGQLEHPQRGARLAHHELPVPHARDGLRRQAAADQRGLHRIGARARQPMRVQSVIPGDLVRSDMTDHLSGQKNSPCRRHGSTWPDTPPAPRPAQPGRMQTAARESIRSRSARPSAPKASVAAGARRRRRAANLGPEAAQGAPGRQRSLSGKHEMASWLGPSHAAHLKAIPSATFLL